MRIVPISQRSAFKWIEEHHRHNKPPRGALFCIGLEVESALVGVVVVGRPVARMLQDGCTAEVTRLCTDGSKNACSKLYSAALNACRAMGYTRLITYTLKTEPGISLKASGFTMAGDVRAESWDRDNRPRTDKAAIVERQRWERAL